MSHNRIRRRVFLGGGTAVALIAAAKTGLAQQLTPKSPTPLPKGPLVWLNLDQAELDAAYNQSNWVPNAQQIQNRYAINSNDVRTRLGVPQRYTYGASAIEQLDVYRTECHNAPINIFIHGGAWRSGLAKDYAFLAELFVHVGVHFVVLDFAWVQDVGGSLLTLAEQVRRAVAWVYCNAQRFGGDANRIYVSGHSSGSHLCGVILTTDWVEDFNLPADIVKGGLCSSGMFDLKPVRLSSRSEYINFSDEVEQALSPQRHLDQLNAPLILAYGSLESPEFMRQSRDFAAAVQAGGKPVQVLVGEEYNHLEMLETLGNPYGILGRAVLEQMQLATLLPDGSVTNRICQN